MNSNNNTTISSIYEVCIGVPDAISAIQYWQQFGYRIGEIGELTATTAYQLYRVNSPLQTIRLYHQNADHASTLIGTSCCCQCHTMATQGLASCCLFDRQR